MTAEEVDWGALHHYCAARAWWEAWSEADSSDEGEQTPSERYILDMARACGQTPQAVLAWRRAYGWVGYVRIQQLAGWQAPEDPPPRLVRWDVVEGIADLTAKVAAVGAAARATIPQIIEFNRQIEAAARALNPHPRGPQQRTRRGR